MEDDKKLSELNPISTISFLYGVDESNESGKMTKASFLAALNAVTDVPSDGVRYLRQDGAWSEAEELSANDAEVINEQWDFAASLKAKGVCLPEVSLSSGFMGNASVTINAGNPAAIDYSFDGLVFTNAQACTFKTVEAQSVVGIPLTNIGVQSVTYIGINENGSLIQSPTQFTALQRRTIAPFAAITHVGQTVIEAIAVQPVKSDDVGGLVNDFFYSFGPINISGNDIEPFDTTLKIKRLPGKVFGRGINFSINPLAPNIRDTPLDSPITFFSNYRNAGSGVVIGVTDSVDPNNWDDGTGTLNPLSGDNAVAHRVYYFPGSDSVIILYGQKEYSNIAAALKGYLTELFENRNDLGRGLFLGWLILENGTTNLTAAFAAGDAFFISSANKSSGAGGGSFDPSADQDITGKYIFDLSTSKQFMIASDPLNPTDVGFTRVVADHDADAVPDSILDYVSILGSERDVATGLQGYISNYNIMPDNGEGAVVSVNNLSSDGTGTLPLFNLGLYSNNTFRESDDTLSYEGLSRQEVEAEGTFAGLRLLATVDKTTGSCTQTGYIGKRTSGSVTTKLLDFDFDADTVTVNADPTLPLGVATKQYVDASGVKDYLGLITASTTAAVGRMHFISNNEGAAIVMSTPASPEYGDIVIFESQGVGAFAPDISAFSGMSMLANETVTLTYLEGVGALGDAWLITGKF